MLIPKYHHLWLRDTRTELGLDIATAAQYIGNTDAAHWQQWENGTVSAPEAVFSALARWQDCVYGWDNALYETLCQAEYHGETLRLPLYLQAGDARNMVDFCCWNYLMETLLQAFPDTAVRGLFDLAAYRSWLHRTGTRDGAHSRLCWAAQSPFFIP